MIRAYALMVAENIVTMLVTGAVIWAGLHYGAGGWSFWGLLIMLNINNPKYIKGS